MTDTTKPRPALRSILTDRLGVLGIRSAQIIAVLILASAVIYGMVQLKLVVIPLLIAIILAAAFSPVIVFLRKRGFSPLLAAWTALIAGIVVLGGVITLIVFAVRGQWESLADSAVEGFNQLLDFIQNGPLPIDAAQVEEFRVAALDFVTSSQFGSGALAGVTVIGEIITGAVLLVVVLFFFLKDGDRIWAFFLTPFTGREHARGERVGQTAVRTLGGYVRGTSIIALVDSVAIGVGIAIVGVPLALPLAVIVFLASFIPIVGATFAGVLAALVALVANGPVAALVVIIIVVAVQQLEGNFLQPVVMAQSLKLHPLVILLALTAGTIIGGVVGAVLSVPIAAVTWAIIKAWKHPEPVVVPVRRRRGLFGRGEFARGRRTEA